MSDALDSLFQAAAAGNARARVQLFTKLYDDLRGLAQRALRRDGPDLTISPTTLLHEAYLDISGRESAVFPDRVHFMAYAAQAMRTLIIDYARCRRAQKRGGGFHITCLPTEVPGATADDMELQCIADAVDALATLEPRLAQVVNLKFFCGYSFADIAAMHGLSERTVQRDWERARLFLHNSLTER